MRNPLVEFRVHRTKDAASKDDGSFTITLESPEKRPDSGDYFCRVSAREIDLQVDVFGVMPQQAIRLALRIASAHISEILCDDATDESGHEKES